MHPPGSGAQASPSLCSPGFVHSAKAWTEDPPARDSTCNPGTEATPQPEAPVPKDRSLMGQLLTAPQSQGAAPRGAGDTRTEDPGPRPSPDPRAASKPKDAPALCFQSYSRFLRSHYLPVRTRFQRQERPWLGSPVTLPTPGPPLGPLRGPHRVSRPCLWITHTPASAPRP